MHLPSLARKWLWLPSRLALLLGLGALSVAGAQAKAPDATEPDGGAAAQDYASGHALVVRLEGESIFVAEHGGAFAQLPLGDTPEARRLRDLLERTGAARGKAGIRIEPTILAGAGGDGFHWIPMHRPDAADRMSAPSAAPLPTTEPGATRRLDTSRPKPPASGTAGSAQQSR